MEPKPPLPSNSRLILSRLSIVATLAFPAALVGQDRIVGLLRLPEVFGIGECTPFVPRDVRVYSGRGTDAIIGTIRVDTTGPVVPDQPCANRKVNFHRSSDGSSVELPTREVGYEVPAAIVLEGGNAWYRIDIGRGSGWVRTGDTAFTSLEQLLREGLTYLTDAADGQLRTQPALEAKSVGPALSPEQSVRVRGSRSLQGRLWLRVELFKESPCESGGEPGIVATGWLPAYAGSGAPTVWFYSRGC